MKTAKQIKNIMNVVKINNKPLYNFIFKLGGYERYVDYQDNLRVRICDIIFELEETRSVQPALAKIYDCKNPPRQPIMDFCFKPSEKLARFGFIQRMMNFEELYKEGKLIKEVSNG